MKKIKVTINRKKHGLEVRDSELLVEMLRERLGLLGTKYSCLEGDCGVCTVIVDGKNVLSCLILAADVDGREVLTIEGLSTNNALHPLQEAFVEKGAIQCGFCTPGMILASKVILDNDPEPSDAKIARGLDGNLCRCTGYIKIIDAVRAAAKRIRSTKSETQSTK